MKDRFGHFFPLQQKIIYERLETILLSQINTSESVIYIYFF